MESKKFNFLKKIVGLRDEVLITAVKDKDDKEVIKNSVCVADEYFSFQVHATQNEKVFDDSFGVKNVKGFLKTVENFDTFTEKPTDIKFSDARRKIIFKKLDEDTVTNFPLPTVDTTGYVNIPLTKKDITDIQTGLKNDLSDYASLRVNSKNKLILKIGELEYENTFELEIKEIERKDKTDTSEIKFLTKLSYVNRLFDSLNLEEADNKVNLALKNDNMLILIEKNSLTNSKFFIAPVAGDDDEEGELDESEI